MIGDLYICRHEPVCSVCTLRRRLDIDPGAINHSPSLGHADHSIRRVDRATIRAGETILPYVVMYFTVLCNVLCYMQPHVLYYTGCGRLTRGGKRRVTFNDATPTLTKVEESRKKKEERGRDRKKRPEASDRLRHGIMPAMIFR